MLKYYVIYDLYKTLEPSHFCMEHEQSTEKQILLQAIDNDRLKMLAQSTNALFRNK